MSDVVELCGIINVTPQFKTQLSMLYGTNFEVQPTLAKQTEHNKR